MMINATKESEEQFDYYLAWTYLPTDELGRTTDPKHKVGCRKLLIPQSVRDIFEEDIVGTVICDEY